MDGACLVRAAFVAGKDVGKAVYRNRARRLLREALRSLLPLLSRGADLVLVASPAMRGARFCEVKRELRRALEAAGLAGT